MATDTPRSHLIFISCNPCLVSAVECNASSNVRMVSLSNERVRGEERAEYRRATIAGATVIPDARHGRSAQHLLLDLSNLVTASPRQASARPVYDDHRAIRPSKRPPRGEDRIDNCEAVGSLVVMSVSVGRPPRGLGDNIVERQLVIDCGGARRRPFGRDEHRRRCRIGRPPDKSQHFAAARGHQQATLWLL
jgi:hypothetical protein